MSTTNFYDQKIGKSFPPAMAFSGYFIMATGIVFTVLGNWLALIIILIGAILAFTWDGIQVDGNKRQFKKYTQIIFYKEGKWISLDKYPEMTILKRNFSSRAYNSTTLSQSVENLFYDICLVDPSHRNQIIIVRSKKPGGVDERAKELSELLEIPLVDFSPKISEQTRNRRHRR